MFPLLTYLKSFYDLHIEDMWLPFFCNTTNIITSRMEVHVNGYAWRYIRKYFLFMSEDYLTSDWFQALP